MLMWFRRVQIRTRLTCGFLLVTALLLTITTVGVAGYSRQQRAIAEVEGSARLVRDAMQVKFRCADLKGWQTGYAFDIVRGVKGAEALGAPSQIAFVNATAAFHAELTKMRSHPLTTGEYRDAEAAEAVFLKFLVADSQLVNFYRSGEPLKIEAANALVLGEEVELFQQLTGSVDRLVVSVTQRTEQQTSAARAEAATARGALLLAGGAGVLLALVLALVISLSITRPLDALQNRLLDIADGEADLSQRLDESGHDTVSSVAHAFNRFCERLANDREVRLRLEIDLRHAQKLESVGRLSAGIAHEINTPVQFIGDNVRFLHGVFADLLALREAYAAAVRFVDEPARLVAALAEVRTREATIDLDFIVEEVPTSIEQTLDGVGRVSTIVGAMKAFGYSNNEKKTPTDLNAAITNTIVVANSQLKYVADVETQFGDLPPVWCHVGDINQVVLNLLINAAHAIEATAESRGRGRITVTTRTDGDAAVIDVTDTGTGIPAEIADKVFEAFFTTKALGVGTGQGLALIRSLVVDRHGGTITFTTEPGVGTTFTVTLPAIGASESASAHDTPLVEVSR